MTELAIAIVRIELSVPFTEIQANLRSEPPLTNFIQLHREGLIARGFEIWHEEQNCIVTDSGYFLAYWATEVEQIGEVIGS